MSFNNIVLALDLSLSQPGFAVLAVTSDGHPILLEKSHVKTTASKPHSFRLKEIADEIVGLIHEYEPIHIVREKGFSRFPATTQALFKVVGMADYILGCYDEIYPIPSEMAEIAPTSAKKLVTGSGKATKEDVQKAVIKRLQIDQPNFFVNDDESDAAAVGLAYLMQKGLIK